MGITAQTLNFLQSNLRVFNGLKMCELGDQLLMASFGAKNNTHSRHLFESRGINYTSIDLNGQGGALRLNLNDDFLDSHTYCNCTCADHCSLGMVGSDARCNIYELLELESFDVVTNFGTSEHVSDFYMCLKNIHSLCKLNGLIFHVVPRHGHWPQHGMHYVTPEFMQEFCKLLGYKLLHLSVATSDVGGPDSEQVFSILFKNGVINFVSREAFNSELGKFIFKD